MKRTLKREAIGMAVWNGMKRRQVPWMEWQAGVELVRSRLFYKALDAAMTATLQPRLQGGASLKNILSLRSSNYERVTASINLIDSLVPGFARRVSTRLCTSDRFPLGKAEVRLMSYGSGATVFRLKWQDQDWVVKVYRRSLGKRGDSLTQIARVFKSKYEIVRTWYDGPFKLVPQAHILILHGPLFGSPAAANLQTYICGTKQDFFRDYTDAALLQLMSEDQELRAQFLFFAERTLAIYEQLDLCVDFLGRENLMLANTGSSYQLRVIDNGIFNMPALSRSTPAAHDRLAVYLERVRYLERELR